jgi:hypothetical protein
MKRATLVRGVSDTEGEPEADPNTRPVGRTTREVVQALIRDPKTSARDVASLTNALTRMNRDGEPDAPDLPVFPFRRGTIIIEPGPGPGSEPRFRFMQRTPEGFAHSGGDYDLTAAQAAYLLLSALGPQLGLTPENLGLTAEEVAAAAKRH